MVELLVYRHAESEFIEAYLQRRDEFKLNETRMSPFERENAYQNFALQPCFIDSPLTQTGKS
jgi:hypothetical protein